jgi:antitoxin (DNA-binding transcriptional repressor) of toxin-antitoxin stability system
MNVTINAKQLRASLQKVVEQVRQGARFTVLYRGRAAFQIVPVDESVAPRLPLEDDPLFHAAALGRSADGRSGADHDAVLCGR